MECTRAVIMDRDWDHDKPHNNFCRCPTCKGFLSPYFPPDKTFTCKKCGTELMLFPDIDEDTGEEIDYSGRICPISFRDTNEKRLTE